jgi:hypothetical protein
MKNIKILFPFILFGFVVACINESCKNSQLVMATPKSPTKLQNVIYKPLLINNYIHDTIKTVAPRKVMTADQLQAYLLPFYRTNFDKLFAPEFTRLNGVITMQAKSIDKISSILTSTRKRTDSIVRERNFYKEAYIKNQRIAIDNQSALLKIQQDNFTKNDKQIKANTALAVGCLTSVLVIFIAFALLYRQVRIISNKFDHHFKQLDHV